MAELKTMLAALNLIAQRRRTSGKPTMNFKLNPLITLTSPPSLSLGPTLTSTSLPRLEAQHSLAVTEQPPPSQASDDQSRSSVSKRHKRKDPPSEADSPAQSIKATTLSTQKLNDESSLTNLCEQFARKKPTSSVNSKLIDPVGGRDTCAHTESSLNSLTQLDKEAPLSTRKSDGPSASLNPVDRLVKMTPLSTKSSTQLGVLSSSTMDGSLTDDPNSIPKPEYSTPLLNSTPSTRTSSSNTNKVPKDTFHLCYIIFFTLGFGYILPWNAFITAVDYFSYIYPGASVNRIFSIVNTLVLLVSLLIVIFFFAHKVNVFVRVNVGLAMFALSLVLMPILDFVYIKGQVGLYSGFYVSVGAISFMSIGNSLVQSGMIGSAGELPEKYMQAVVAGNGASGILVSALRIITKASYPQDANGLRKSANLYFIVGVVVMVVCIILYNVVPKLPVIRHYSELHLQAVKEEVQENGHVSWSAEISTLKDMVLRVKWHGIGLLMIYIVTLSIFPGYITEDVHSEALKDWYPIVLITGFNVFDFVGRSLTAVYVLEDAKVAIGVCIARVLFYPLFSGCLYGPPFFRTEVVVTTLTCLVGLTNGYLTSVLMILAPKLVPLQHKRIAGTVMVLFLVLGLALGSIVSWIWKI